MDEDQRRAILAYLRLPENYEPSLSLEPIQFLQHHIHNIPPQFATHFSSITTPKQRTSLPTIRNRRHQYTESSPPELSFPLAKATWPALWQGRSLSGRDGAQEEEDWVKSDFLVGEKKHVGKLGPLLGGYEEEREAERARTLRRREAEIAESLPEEDEDSDDEGSGNLAAIPPTMDSPEELRRSFVRLVKERFIYGLLENANYDKVDWDEKWDIGNDRDAEERWFDEEEEEEVAIQGE